MNKELRPGKLLIKRLKSKFRLNIINEKTFEEKFSYSLTPLNVLIMFGSLLFIFGFLIYLLVAFTPLRNYVIPDYASAELRADAYYARFIADSLLEESQKSQTYLNHLRLILNGQNPDSTSHNTDIQSANHSVNDSLMNDITDLDSALRVKVLNQDRFGISIGAEKKGNNGALMYPPVIGPISSPFNPKEGHFGIDIVAPEDDPVKAILDGTVIVAAFTSEDGNIIQIQHANNIVSVYKHNAAMLRRQGDQVRAGESIAFIGDSGDHSEGPHLHFEIWESGVPVNPADYISFGQ
jgi:murein DD-endopeptidase MepM/ murein hydrolase activator NlpD